MIENICNTLQIAIKLIKPFSKEIYFEAESMKKPIKKFTFLNSLIDHVDTLDKLQSQLDKLVGEDNLFLILSNRTCLGLWESDFINELS